jgi:hypothetical protein
LYPAISGSEFAFQDRVTLWVSAKVPVAVEKIAATAMNRASRDFITITTMTIESIAMGVPRRFEEPSNERFQDISDPRRKIV